MLFRSIKNPIIRAIYFHHELIRIHPFADGNGRVTRIAKNWMLMYNLYPPIFINDAVEKKEYINTLSNSFKNIDSKILLSKRFELHKNAGYYIVNIDSSLCLQAPKIKDYIPQMQQVIADILSLQINDVSIKATTTEKMGFVGREEGLVAYATILIKNI